jgi:hypothetical protein
VAELTEVANACCPAELAASCCEPNEKAECCGHGDGCRCQIAGQGEPSYGSSEAATAKTMCRRASVR